MSEVWRSQLGVLDPARLLSVPSLTAETTFMFTLPPSMNFPTDPAFELLFLLLWVLLCCFCDLVDPGSLLERALLGDVVGLLAQDEGGDCLQ